MQHRNRKMAWSICPDNQLTSNMLEKKSLPLVAIIFEIFLSSSRYLDKAHNRQACRRTTPTHYILPFNSLRSVRATGIEVCLARGLQPAGDLNNSSQKHEWNRQYNVHNAYVNKQSEGISTSWHSFNPNSSQHLMNLLTAFDTPWSPVKVQMRNRPLDSVNKQSITYISSEYTARGCFKD